MKTLFNLDSPIMRALAKMTNILWLNFLTLVCVLLVVPGGAALTALSYVNLKLARDEECYVTQDYFKSFKLNFKQGTILGLISFVVAIVLVMDYLIFASYELPMENVLKVAIAVAAIIFSSTQMFLWPTLAKFDNSVRDTIKNAFSISILQFPKTVIILIMSIISAGVTIAPILPLYPFYLYLETIIRVWPLFLLFGVAAPAYWAAKMYNKFFLRLENGAMGEDASEEEEVDDEERIFHDELDATLVDREEYK